MRAMKQQQVTSIRHINIDCINPEDNREDVGCMLDFSDFPNAYSCSWYETVMLLLI